MPAFEYNAIPGYKAAVDKENLSRNACFLPVYETIAGFAVMPMTVRHYVMLRTVGNPLLSGQTPNVIDVISFLWILSPKFKLYGGRHKRKLVKAFRGITIERFAEIVFKAREYCAETFQDRPSATSDKSIFTKQYYSDVSYICATFAKHFGWDDESTLGKPMKRIFQYMKVLREQSGEKVVHFNPSDAIAMKFIAAKEQEEAAQ